ncbi:nuclear transport factor 2 family protein [Flaviramulus sp. BrNp1-15]|uniref:nuclear transport factor 2 family protein n=1 Tax=Flaviramulus sp. BrNp1-15 TaxID=2916754 RepID=UPI001EE7F48E|nr:nuclear transport factor 2 family protein [Flaviramulus sp. BrNp1-15]ULC60309.1 nuclear transport factor 2 family protein [Flaviramulus sp. BrNp1-15]
MIKTKKTTVFLFITLMLSVTISNSQNQNNSKKDLEAIITYHDSIFWEGFNTCNLSILKDYISDDLEFYHDKNGLTVGAEIFLKVTDKNLCTSKGQWRLRREVVTGSVKIYPINNYGAIMSGEHQFFITENNKPEYLDGISKFTNIWQLKENKWKMTRVLSYDHKAPPQNTDKKEILLPDKILNSYIGEYSTHTGTISVSIEDKTLKIKAGEMIISVYAQSESSFYSKEKPLTFEFVKNDSEPNIKMIVREKGNIVEKAIKN